MLTEEYDEWHKYAINLFCNHYIQTGSLGYPNDTTDEDYCYDATFSSLITQARCEFFDNVELYHPPEEQPDSVRKLFWKNDDPLLTPLGF